MSAVVEMWMGELEKLREKVRAKKKPFPSSRAENEQQQEVEDKQKAKKETRQHVEEETLTSETTICLIMDRIIQNLQVKKKNQAMSGIVDTWTNEVAKLREKGRTIGSSPGGDQSRQDDGITKEGNILSGKLSSLIQDMKDKSLKVVLLPHSEASVSMLVDCFSP
ncbi:hypothetical protein Q3G72_019462 [Acer saccharum]|nr:hypothetical protein Q3G72_019462 [Acer saccharum]